MLAQQRSARRPESWLSILLPLAPAVDARVQRAAELHSIAKRVCLQQDTL